MEYYPNQLGQRRHQSLFRHRQSHHYQHQLQEKLFRQNRDRRQLLLWYKKLMGHH
jgi:hypothetical protein